MDCTVPVTFAPLKPGQHSAAVSVTSGTTGTGSLAGLALGSVLTTDLPTPATANWGSAIKPSAVAVSPSGNVYAIDANTGNYVQVQSNGSVVVLGAGAPTGTASLAVDSAETLYAVGSSSTSVSTMTLTAGGTYTAGSVSPAGVTAPRVVAVDSTRTLYVYDASSQTIYRLPNTTNVASVPVVVGSGYSNVVGLTVDPNGYVIASDAGTQTIYKIPPTGAATSFALGYTPGALASDAGAGVYVVNATGNSVSMYTTQGVQSLVLSGLTSPAGVAVDGNGTVYVADSSQTAVIAVSRTNVSYDFGTSTTATISGTLANAGNVVATQFAQTDASDFGLSAGTSNGCNFLSTALGQGQACTFSADFTPTASGTGPVSDALTLLPSATATGALTLDGTKTGGTVNTMTTVSGQTPNSPVYLASGTEVSFTVTVTPTSGSANGTVNVSIDGGTATGYTVTSNTATVALSGLAAGSHSIAATYPSQGGIVGSSSSTVNFSIAQASTSVSWTPGATSEYVSQAVGANVLNATTPSGVAGAFTYTATPSGGSPIAIDAASYLPIGTYALAVTFTPTDATDYTGSTGSVSSFTVTQAPTTSNVGATLNLVAADGSGNFTSLAAAVAALPTTGGAIYLAPGTYTGQVTVAYPNVSLRGLGGDPTKVIVTAENGAVPNDQGSATLNVAKTTLGGHGVHAKQLLCRVPDGEQHVGHGHERESERAGLIGRKLRRELIEPLQQRAL